MDYGRTSQSGTDPLNSRDISAVSPESLGANNEPPMSSEQDRDLRSLGNRAITSPESSSNESDMAPEDSQNSPELGKVIDLSLPPGSEKDIKDESKIFEASANVSGVNFANIKTTGGKLSKSSTREVGKVINIFEKGGNAEEFYDDVRGEEGAVAANLNNSYGENSALKEAA